MNGRLVVEFKECIPSYIWWPVLGEDVVMMLIGSHPPPYPSLLLRTVVAPLVWGFYSILLIDALNTICVP